MGADVSDTPAMVIFILFHFVPFPAKMANG